MLNMYYISLDGSETGFEFCLFSATDICQHPVEVRRAAGGTTSPVLSLMKHTNIITIPLCIVILA